MIVFFMDVRTRFPVNKSGEHGTAIFERLVPLEHQYCRHKHLRSLVPCRAHCITKLTIKPQILPTVIFFVRDAKPILSSDSNPRLVESDHVLKLPPLQPRAASAAFRRRAARLGL
ncbi:MAG TPA: hypothetical protein VGU61_17525, partial [Noviherbaspirillum sp.]|uniref:hypothetical protein n=1 Tax=Noviherbaspirillum sp. TaxID=1926288 RepID=UPI002DDD4AC7